MTREITAQQLHERLAKGDGTRVIDVLTPEDFACRHLPGAGNACVYEVVFFDRMAEIAPDKETPLVVYDATGTTRAAATALDKLVGAGYANVQLLDGGLAGWQGAGYPVEGSGATGAEPCLRDGTYRLDTTDSVLEWIGRNIGKRHYGRIDFAGGELVIRGGELVAGEFTLDMATIRNLDLENELYRNMLEAHLRSEDFFHVARYPAATFAFTGWEAIGGATPGKANYTLHGRLTIKGITHPVTFPAVVAPHEDGSLRAQTALDIDRTAWNIFYGSGSLFEKLGMHLVHDLISLELFIVAR